MNLEIMCPLIHKGACTNLLKQRLFPTTELEKTVRYAFIKYGLVTIKCTFKLVMNELKPSPVLDCLCLTDQFALALQQHCIPKIFIDLIELQIFLSCF